MLWLIPYMILVAKVRKISLPSKRTLLGQLTVQVKSPFTD